MALASGQPSNLKLLLIGNSSVGKSSLLLRFTDDDFLSEEETTATIEVDFKVKSIELNGEKYQLSIWDTAGQERFRTLTSSYHRGAQGVVMVYDVSSRDTFDELLKWFQEVDTYCGDLQSGKYSDGANAINYTDREKVHAYDNPPHVGPRAADANHPDIASHPAVKKGMFGRKGKYDATAQPVTEHSAVDAAPRQSEAPTIVSN